MISCSGVCVLCTASKMNSVGIFVFILGLLCYVHSGKFYESTASNQKMPLHSKNACRSCVKHAYENESFLFR